MFLAWNHHGLGRWWLVNDSQLWTTEGSSFTLYMMCDFGLSVVGYGSPMVLLSVLALFTDPLAPRLASMVRLRGGLAGGWASWAARRQRAAGWHKGWGKVTGHGGVGMV